MQMRQMMTVSEAVAITGHGKATFYDNLRRGEVSGGTKLGGSWPIAIRPFCKEMGIDEDAVREALGTEA